MKRTLIEKIPFALPEELEKLVTGAHIYDSSCSPEARVYFIDRDGGYYLKRGARCALETEAAMTDYFHKKGLGAEVLFYGMYEGCDWLLSSRVAGEDCTHKDYLADPKRLADLLGERLRALHETDPSGCPVRDHTAHYLATAERNYRAGRHDVSYFGDVYTRITPSEVWAVLEDGKSALKNEVLLHGDYCLPNIMLDSWHLSGFIDVGNGGVGDRHVDLFWGAWTLRFNLGTDKYRDRFLDSYGRDGIIPEKLKIIAAAEVFG